MELKSNKIKDFKEMVHKGMIECFERDGYLEPILFVLLNENTLVISIPNDFLSSQQGKQILASKIKEFCLLPDVLAIAMVIEAYGLKMDNDDELTKEVIDGKKRVSETDGKQDIIMMIVSTPEKDETKIYGVNLTEKKIINDFGEPDNFKGIFSGFFNWKRN